MRRNRLVLCLAVVVLSCLPFKAHGADSFDRQTSGQLQELAEKQKPLMELTMPQAARLKPLPGLETAGLVIKTESGNWAKALVSWGFRKSAGKPVPVVVLERHATFGPNGDITLASGKNVMLFPGFSFDFDIGQVVPEGMGADLQISPTGSVRAVDSATIFALDGSTLEPEAKSAKPNPADHDGVLPRDFTGTWLINADGRWQGTWTLNIDEEGNAKGEFLSDETKSLYQISGKVAQGHRIKLNIELANATQSFDAFLWTKDKSAMAGTLTMAGKTFGFYAVRDGKN